MPAKDIYHDAVKNALIKDGWLIIADPYIIKYEDAELYADLAAEKREHPKCAKTPSPYKGGARNTKPAFAGYQTF